MRLLIVLPVLLVALLVVTLATAVPAAAQRFVAITFHDVVDDERDLGSDDITTGRLIAFFDWLRGNGWTAISLDDVAAAGRGTRKLPPNPILLTFDDGFRSVYTRVYPLLLAYRMPAIFALVGSWMDAPPDGQVRYGDEMVPRSRFLSWGQAREMAASGFAEFASHSYDLHKGVLGNPQGSMMPAASSWEYDPSTGRYGTDATQRARVRADLERSTRLMRNHLGRAPRAVVWPFGRYSQPAVDAARDAGFVFALTLDLAPADARQPMRITRLFPTRNPKLDTLTESLRFADPTPTTRRVVCLSIDPLWHDDARARETALGETIEAVRRLGANTVVLDPAVAQPPGAPMGAVWFPTALRPIAADLLGFVAWQLRSRGGAEVYLRADLRAAAAAVGEERVTVFIRDLARVAPINGLVLDPPGTLLNGGKPIAPYPWTVREARIAADVATLDHDGQRALVAWRAAALERPSLQLGLVAPAEPPGEWPTPVADWLLLGPPADDLPALAQRLAARGWLTPSVTSRVVLPLAAVPPRSAADAMRRAQTLGATAFSLCPPPDLPTDQLLNAAFSASTFLRLP